MKLHPASLAVGAVLIALPALLLSAAPSPPLGLPLPEVGDYWEGAGQFLFKGVSERREGEKDLIWGNLHPRDTDPDTGEFVPGTGSRVISVDGTFVTYRHEILGSARVIVVDIAIDWSEIRAYGTTRYRSL